MSAHLDMPRFHGRALCAETDPELFYPDKGGPVREAKALCGSCEARPECLAYAVDRGLYRWWDGIWGGATPAERRAMAGGRRARPGPVEHGTERGWKAHRRRGEEPCAPCRDGLRLAGARRRAERGAA